MRNLVTIVAAFLVVACGGTAGNPSGGTLQQENTGQPTTQDAGKEKVCGKPFHGPSWGTTSSVVAYPLVHNVFSGSAVVTGLGRSRIAFPHDWNLVDKSVTGSMTITAANGDELFASVTGSAMFRPDGLVADLDQFASIDGGTGRFEGAGGSFTIVGTITRATGEVIVFLDGHLVRDQPCD